LVLLLAHRRVLHAVQTYKNLAPRAGIIAAQGGNVTIVNSVFRVRTGCAV
jgi:hypothetical protein